MPGIQKRSKKLTREFKIKKELTNNLNFRTSESELTHQSKLNGAAKASIFSSEMRRDGTPRKDEGAKSGKEIGLETLPAKASLKDIVGSFPTREEARKPI